MEAKATNESFVITWEDDKQKNATLQNSFLKFKQEREKEIRIQRRRKLEKRSAESLDKLRQKFLDTALSYMGVPYARRYHGPDSPYYNAPLYLDCCGLVRRVLLDLKEEFGFTIGPWNQAYMFDTLPIRLGGPADMKPGDLVFVSGIYNNPKSKQQKHNMVHVEVWLGEGEKTVGARWQKSVVEIHDSYQYTSKSYHSMKYHFCSINTWLNGICQSYCSEHPWKRNTRSLPGKKSIFCCDEEEEQADPIELLDQDSLPYDQGHEACNQNQTPCGHNQTPCDHSQVLCDHNQTLCNHNQAAFNNSCSQRQILCDQNQAPCDPVNKPDDSSSTTDPPSLGSCDDNMTVTGASIGGSTPTQQYPYSKLKVTPHKTHTPAKPFGSMQHSFYIAGHNGNVLLHNICLSHGWRPLEDSSSSAFFFKWTELKRDINYTTFREGQQLVNHFPNINILTTKIGLLECLREYDRINSRTMPHHRSNFGDFFPLTYRLDNHLECEEFYKKFKEGDVWICKPNAANQGKGIFLVKDLDQLKIQLLQDQKNCKATRRPVARIVQWYINNPLLLDQRKFDIRMYLLIVSARPYVVLWHQGYIRLSCLPYQCDSAELGVHLTNQYVQKRQPLYNDTETIWSMEQLQDYIDKHLAHSYSLHSNWVQSELMPAMCRIMLTCFHTIKDKLHNRLGYFELLGFDFILDATLKLWLIEVNVNPALHTKNATLQRIIPPMLEETVDIVVECFDKCSRQQQLLPLTSLRNFISIYGKH
ncbi:protein polyglycylase TTLL10-like isoform X2 [Dysidea avara]|uniref:protein polyglycylase TTLL10-like isoform X2 n=1 Tax=Dysidea avara TaxID=196820 RepID=UPI003323BC49